MGLSDAVPSDLAWTVGDSGRRLSLERTPRPPDAAAWVGVETLELDVPARLTNGQRAEGVEHLKTRRLALRAAILDTDPVRLQAGLRGCVSASSGFSELRVWFANGAAWIGGRMTLGHREAPFTIRLAVEPRAPGERRLALYLGDVRLYGPLPLPAPLVGGALARAIVAGCGGRSPGVVTREGGLEVAPLDLALVPLLVLRGWRMPDLSAAQWRGMAPGGDGGMQLCFGEADQTAAPPSAASASPGCQPYLEGERLPAALASAERALFAGDVRAAEDAYRAHLAERPASRAAQTRLVALAAPTGTAVLDAGARALTRAWPEWMPGWLYAALGAWQAGEREAAASAFMRASAVAAARGESEDARMAAEAAAAVRDGAPQAAPAAPVGPVPTPQGRTGEASAPIPAPFAAIARALMAGDRASADAAIAEHLRDDDAPARRGSLHAEVAEAVLAAGGGAALALATVAEVSLAGSSLQGLELRAELAESEGNAAEAARALGELITRAVAAGELTRARTFSDRQARLRAALDAAAAIPRPIEASDPGNVTARTEAVYATAHDTQARSGALTELLRNFDHLSPERRRAAYASFGRVAEDSGDLDHAEEAYWRGMHVPLRDDDPPDQRAHFLIAHARLLIARGNDRAAAADLDEALRISPHAAPALAARAELAFRAHAFALAREMYARLDGAPGASEAIARDTLVRRRAMLARDAADDAAAEAHFLELAAAHPRHVEARQALAELAIKRNDRTAAVQRLEEVLRLLPLDQLDAMLDVRERLGDLYAELGDWGAVRHYQELILAQDGDRVTALERLIEALSRLELFEEAADACERLSRLHPDPAKRAEALHRQGELLLGPLNDEPRAFDAFLKASDLAPGGTPTALRLVNGFWMRGRFGDVAEVASELGRTGALARAPLVARLRAVLAAAIAGHEPAPITPAGIEDAREQPRVVAEALAEAARGLGAATPASLEPAVKAITGSGGSEARAALASLTGALTSLVIDDPAAVGGGAALALGWLADRRAEPALARPLYAVAAFLEVGDGAASRHAELGPCPPPSPASMALAGGNDHPGVGGTAAPLRRALGALAHGLAGFGALGTRPAGSGGPAIAGERSEAWHALATAMAAPPLELIVAEEPGDTFPDVAARATRPGLITIPGASLESPDDELTFLVARAVDHLRGGLALVDAITSREPREVEALLRGAAAALAGRTPPELPLAIAAASELGSPDRVAALVGTAPRPRVAGDLLLAEEALVGWEGFRAAAALASDRFALLACRSALAALRALYRRHDDDALMPEQARRTAFLRSPRVRELVSYMTSAAYADATRDAARE